MRRVAVLAQVGTSLLAMLVAASILDLMYFNIRNHYIPLRNVVFIALLAASLGAIVLATVVSVNAYVAWREKGGELTNY